MAFWNRTKELMAEINQLKGAINTLQTTNQSLRIQSQSVNEPKPEINEPKQSDNSWDLTDPDNFSKAINSANGSKELDWIQEKRKAQLKVRNSERMRKWQRDHPNYRRSEVSDEEMTDGSSDDMPLEWYETAVDAWKKAPALIKNPVNSWMKDNLHFEIDDILGDRKDFSRTLSAIRNQQSEPRKEEEDETKKIPDNAI